MTSTPCAADMQSLNQLHQRNLQVGEDHQASESFSHNRTFDAGLKAQGNVGIGASGDVANASASLGGSAGVTWSWQHNKSDQHSSSNSENFSENKGYSHNVENVFRGVAEGHYRANTEEGQRILDSISTSLDHAHQEQQQASAQFQESEAYRKVASISEEQVANINANASQEFMNEIQKEQSMRSIEDTMVNHLEQAKDRAEKFVQEKFEQYFQNFKDQENISPNHIQEIYREDSRLIEKQAQENIHDIYQSKKSNIQSRAESSGFKDDNFVDKRPAENVGKLIVEKSLETDNDKNLLNSVQDKMKKQIKKTQDNIF